MFRFRDQEIVFTQPRPQADLTGTKSPSLISPISALVHNQDKQPDLKFVTQVNSNGEDPIVLVVAPERVRFDLRVAQIYEFECPAEA